jgi:signal transduction histidine kinase
MFALDSGGGVGTWDWDVPNDRVYCGAQFARLFSLDPESAAAGIPLLPFVSQIHAEDRAQVEESIQRVLAVGGDFTAECRIVQADGTSRWIYARGHCHLDETGKPSRFPGVAFDISERKRIESDLRLSNDELRRLNRELEEFAYVASHDLQEPLRMINVYTQLIMRNLHTDRANLDQYAAYVHQGIAKMQMLIRDLLSFSHAVHTLELPSGTADLGAALNAAIAVLESQISETRAVITAEPLPHVRGETTHIAHVFQNLLSNSLKYVTKGVRPIVHVSIRRDGPECVVTVRDNGIGFEPHHAERIFKLFKRLHTDEYPGTGLGLAICKRIVERYGGRVWAESRPGEGAAFHFTLLDAG